MKKTRSKKSRDTVPLNGFIKSEEKNYKAMYKKVRKAKNRKDMIIK